MAHKPDVPCAGGCGKFLWRGPGSLPPGERMCRQCRTEAAAPADDASPVPESPRTPADGFGERGRWLWREMKGPTLEPTERLLLEETCRLADRLDRLDAFLVGREDAWLRFRARNEDGSIVTVVVDRALTEARQQADTLRGIVADLRQARSKSDELGEAKGSILDELAKRRTERQQQAAGQ